MTKEEERTLEQIIDDLRGGGRPEYEEIRYALLVCDQLSNMDSLSIRRLGLKTPSPTRIKFTIDENFRRWKEAGQVPPKAFLGPEGDPDDPLCQQRREWAKKLYLKALDRRKGEP